MNKHSLNHIKKLLFIGLIGMLFIILLQGHFQLLEVEPLQGSYGMVDDPAISKASWFDGSYQEQEALYINQNFGFRSTFVRSYNQWYFSRYNQARANGVIIGKEDYLYEFLLGNMTHNNDLYHKFSTKLFLNYLHHQ